MYAQFDYRGSMNAQARGALVVLIKWMILRDFSKRGNHECRSQARADVLRHGYFTLIIFTWPVGVHYLIPFTKSGLTQPIKCLDNRVLAADNRVSARNFHVAKVNSREGSAEALMFVLQFIQLSGESENLSLYSLAEFSKPLSSGTLLFATGSCSLLKFSPLHPGASPR